MIGAMTSTAAVSRKTSWPRWVLGLLAVLIAALALILGATSASASAASAAETRVGVHSSSVEVPVEPPQHIAAGQRLGKDVAEPETVVATGVAAKAETEVPSVAYNRAAHYGGAATESPAGQAIRAGAEGQACPMCGRPMVRGTDTAPVPEHSPPLVKHYYEHGGWQMTSEEARAYARSADAFDGAMCPRCQASQGGQLSWYSRAMKELFGL